MTVISPGPLIIVRVPWPMPRWRAVLRAMTAVMQSHGLRQKDIHEFDGMIPADPSEREVKDWDLVARLDAAYEGAADRFPRFWLYDWDGEAFKLTRRPTEISS
jgi:hypothetical protein